MKQIILLFTILCFSNIMHAQNFTSTQEKEVYNTISRIGKAWTENNLDSLEKYIGPDYLHTDVRGQLLDRASWLNYVKERKLKSVTNADIMFDSVKIKIYNDIAFVTGINIFSGSTYVDEKTKKKATQRIRFTQVLKKQNGIWQRILFQATYMSND